MRLGKEHCRQDSVLDQPPASGLEPARAVSPYATKTSPAPTAPTGDLPAERFWRQALGDLAGPTPLIIDSRRHDTNRCKPARQHILLEPDLASRLADLSRRHDLPCEMIFHAAWAMLLHRYSGESQIIFGATPGLRDGDASGSTTPLIPICLTVDKERSVLDWLATAHGAWTSFHPFRQTPPERIRQWIGWPAEVPLFESAIQVDAPEPAQLQCPLHLTVRLAQTPSLIITFDPSRLDGPAAGRLLGHYRNLLAGMAEDPSRPLWQLPLLDPQERQQLLIDWNRTAQDYPNDTCIHQLFAQQAQKTPHATALVFEQQTLTYEQLNRRANQLAHHLIARGVGPDTLVGICCERSLEMVVGLLAILKAGGAYVPLDPNYPPERLAFMLQDAAVPILLTQRPLLEKLPPHQAQTLCLDADWATLDPYPTHDPDVPLSPDHLAYVIYTSGSTGRPKGVMIEHRGLTNYLTWCIHAYAVSEGNGAPVHSSLAFDLTVTSLYAPLLTGRTVILIAAGQEVDGLSAVLRETPSLSLVKITPVHLKLLGEHVREDEAIGRVRAFVIGGEALYPEHVAFWRNCAAGSRLINEYGPTETVVGCCIYEILASQPMPETIPIGRPIANTQLYILDPHLQPVPVGVPGELFIGGHGLARGYLNRPELTKEKFLPNPFDPHTRLYRTGDLARYLPDGNIEFLGRLDHQVKLRGFRIELGEIEAVLAQHPAVRQAVVLLREDTPGDKRLVAYLVPSDTPPTPDELRQHLKQKLPDYMVPSAFVLLDALPLSPNGKIDRRALPAPDTSLLQNTQTYVAPRNPTEQALADIWTQVLNLPTVGIHDNFFELGGHSLLATQVISRLRQRLNADLPVRALFESPTVAQLAGKIDKLDPSSQAPAIQPADRTRPLALSFAQQRLWFLDQYESELAVYNIPFALHLTGPLDRAALERSLAGVIQRHESLRTTFAVHQGQPVQVIHPHTSFTLPLTDLSDLSEPQRQDRLQALTEQEARGGFDLSSGPLLRARLVRLEDQRHTLLLTVHHIVSDGWSMGVFFDELAIAYNAFSRHESPAWPALPIQYADFAQWQRQWLQGQVLDEQLAYWKRHLAGAPAILELPTDHPRPPVQSYRGARQTLLLPRPLSDDLLALGRHENVTLFMTLLAGFNALLHRYSGQDDIVVGAAIANRNHAEIENLIGFFVNALPLRTQFSGELTVSQLLARVREVTLGGYGHQDLPFEKLVEELKPQRSLSHSPLFQVMMVLQNAPSARTGMPDLEVRWEDLHTGTAKFDLVLAIEEQAQGLALTLEYSTDLFEAATIQRLLGHYRNLLAGMAQDPSRPLWQLPLLEPQERQQLLIDWNRTAQDYPNDTCIHQLFAQQAQKTPHATALVFEQQTLTYEQLNHQANQLAHHLIALGVGPETLVGICCERSLEMVIGLLAILKAGGAYVPLDPNYPPERLAFMLQDANVSVLLTQERLIDQLPPHQAQTLRLDADWATLDRYPTGDPAIAVSPDNLAYVIYTSGSTGKPKGVEVPHRGVLRLVFGVDYAQFDASRVFLQLAPIAFDASTLEIWGSLLHGARCILFPRHIPEPAELGVFLKQQKVTTLWLTSSLYNLVIDQAPDALADLRELLIGGEALSVAHVRRGLELLPHTQIINGYGPTESTTFTCCYRIPRSLDSQIPAIPIGRPIANTRIYILDPHFQPVPIGVPGELFIGGDGLARGYLNRPDLTAQKFIPHPFDDRPGARLYRTGDLARYLPDGNIEFLGRLDHQVKLRGFRIELGEIEATLAQHPAVRQAVVLLREDTPGDKRLVAYLVPADTPPTPDELRQHLKQKLPDYMVPSAFVLLDALPLSPNGKIDRKALPAPDTSRAKADAAAIPTDQLELQLLQIWEQVLNVRPIGTHDNFFDLGGHSLLAVRLFAAIEHHCTRKLPLALLFQHPTIAQLAGVLRNDGWSHPDSTLVPIQPGGSRPPLFCVPGAGGHVFSFYSLTRRLGLDQPVYGLQLPGADGRGIELKNVEDVAAHNIREIRAIQPHGPYYLGGYSLGGMIVFEMARQFRAMGEQVALLALFDSWGPGYPKILPPPRRFLLHLKVLLSLNWREQFTYLGQRLRNLLRRFHRTTPNVVDRSIAGTPLARTIRHAARTYHQAWRRYVPRTYPGRLVLFNSVVKPDWFGATFDDPTMGWGKLAALGVDVRPIPGAHLDIFKDASLQVLADELRNCLQAAVNDQTPPTGEASA